MSYCTGCGRPRSGSAQFCTACGTPFAGPAQAAGPAATEGTSGGWAPPGLSGTDPPAGPGSGKPGGGPSEDDSFGSWFRADPAPAGLDQTRQIPPPSDPGPGGIEFGRPPRQPMTSRRIVIALAVLVLLAAGGTGAWLTLRHRHAAAAPPAAAGRTQTTPPQTSSAPTGTPARSPTASTGNGLVTVAPGVSRQAAEPQVVTFLGGYFAAINQHDYQRYSVLLGPRTRHAETAQVFHAGYRTTTDSAITLTGISAAGAGQVEAYVTFTSHQTATDSPSHSGCTDWRIILVLAPQHGSLVLEPPPPGYHASFRAC